MHPHEYRPDLHQVELLKSIKLQLTWCIVLLSVIALGVLAVAAVALTVPVYPR